MKLAFIGSTICAASLSVFAQAKPGAQGFDPTIIFMMVAMFAIVYFLMIRPQQKKQKETQSMLEKMQKGDKVVTIGGVFGTIGSVKDSTVMVKIAENTVIEIKKSAIAAVVNDDKTEKVESKDEKSKDEKSKEDKK